MKKAIELLNGFSLKELIEQFELTTDNNEEGIFEVRGWLMKVIEEKNPKGFDNWLESEECEDGELKNYVL